MNFNQEDMLRHISRLPQGDFAAVLSLRSVSGNLYALQREQSFLQGQLIGRSIRILSEYNGQPYGRSRKSLKGSVHKISRLTISEEGLFVSIEGYEYGCPYLEMSEWELLPKIECDQGSQNFEGEHR